MDANLLVERENKGNIGQHLFTYIIVGIALLLMIVVLTLLFLSGNNPKDSNASAVTLLPENTCPTKLTEYSGRVSAIYNGETVEMSEEIYEWVKVNCNFETPTSY